MGVGAGREGLEVLGETSIAAEPSAGLLDDSSTGQDVEALRVDGTLYDFEAEVEIRI